MARIEEKAAKNKFNRNKIIVRASYAGKITSYLLQVSRRR